MKPLTEAWLGYEQVDQGGLVTDSDAVTLRRPGRGGHCPRSPGPLAGIRGHLAPSDSDRDVCHYGDEIDPLATATKGRTQASARFARYMADQFATDISKFWIELDWAY